MNWVQLLAAALALWGWAFPPPIVVLEESEPPRPGIIANVTHDDETCFIHVYPSKWAPEYDPQFTITHEVGHCLSLRHIEQQGVMSEVYTPGTEFSGYDRALFWQSYPAPYRVTIAMVGQ